MKLSIVTSIGLAAIGLAAQTNELVFPVDVVALGRLGNGTNINGWVATGLDNYSAKNKFALQFSLNLSRADSPTYPAPITAVDITAFSSSASNLTRRLVVIAHPRRPVSDATNLVYRCAASATTTSPIAQTVIWDPALDIRSFSLAVEYLPSARTGWGVNSLVVHTQKPPGFTICVR